MHDVMIEAIVVELLSKGPKMAEDRLKQKYRRELTRDQMRYLQRRYIAALWADFVDIMVPPAALESPAVKG